MSRVYSVTFSSVAVSASQDLFEISPADDKAVRLHGLLLSQSSDTGDAAEEILPIRVIRGNTSSGSGGSGPTPTPLNPSDAAAGFAAEVNNTSGASAGTAVDLLSYNFNIRSGFEFFWTPETMPLSNQGAGFLLVRLAASPADAITMSGTLYIEEL